MNDHYYTTDPGSISAPREITGEYRGLTIRFITDNGVFSKNEVDPGSRLLIHALPDPMTGTLCDIGCGWGAMGVSLAKRYPLLKVTMSDVNERALDLCKKNAALNRVEASILESDGMKNVEGVFDYIITNPPIRAGKAVIYRFFEEASQKLKTDGALYIVIRKQQGAASAEKYLRTLFESVNTIERSGGYHVLECRGPIKMDKE